MENGPPKTSAESDQLARPGEATVAASDELIATAYHEAGHAVMAILLGRSVMKVTINAGNLAGGGVRLGACEMKKGRPRGSGDWIEDEVLILLAGMIGQSHHTAVRCHGSAKQDLRQAGELLAARAGNERQMIRLQNRLLAKAEHLLSDPTATAAVKRIATELLRSSTLSGRAVLHHCRQCGIT